MQTVSSPFISFNDADEAIGAACRCGHVDEAIATLADDRFDRFPPGFHEEYGEYLTEQAITTADADHAETARRIFAEAVALVGPAAGVKITRTVGFDNYLAGEPRERPATWSVFFGGKGLGDGATPDEALANAVMDLDAKAGICTRFGGYVVPGVASVQAWPHRSKAEALGLARRFALSRSHLAAALDCQLPGVAIDSPSPLAAAIAG